MRSIFAVFAGLVLASAAFAQDKAAGSGGTPKITFAQTVFDFGTVKSGQIVTNSFVFTNTGSATLTINEVKPGCGCTTAGAWDKIVEPGHTGSIRLQYNSSGFGGKVTKVTTVTSSDPSQPSIVLQITGNVWRPIDFTPTMAMFNAPPEGQTNETRTIHIVSNIDEPLTLEQPVLNNPSFRTELAVIKPGKEFDLRVTAIPPFTNSYLSAPITIKTSSKEMPQINTSAYLTVLPAVQVMPAQLMLPAGPLKQNGSWTVTIRGNTAKPLTLTEPSINYPGAFLAINEMEAGKSYVLTLGLPAGFQVQPGQAIEATLKSNNPLYPVVKVPITQPPSVSSIATIKPVGAIPGAGH